MASNETLAILAAGKAELEQMMEAHTVITTLDPGGELSVESDAFAKMPFAEKRMWLLKVATKLSCHPYRSDRPSSMLQRVPADEESPGGETGLR